MWVADVGQNALEEIDVVTGPGQNFGWVEMEGCSCTSTCTPSNFVLPVHNYPHSVGS